MQIINTTPHEVRVLKATADEVDFQNPVAIFPPPAKFARVDQKTKTLYKIPGDGGYIPITRNSYGEVKNLPPPKQDTLYIVSWIVAREMEGKRNDLLIVNGAINIGGRIVGCRSLSPL